MMHPGGNYRDVHFGTTHQACQAQDLNVQVANVQEQHSNDAMQQQLMNLSINNNDVSQENGGYTIVQNGEDVQQQSVCVDMDNGENRGCINAPEFQDVESNPNYDAKSQEKADEFLRQLLEEEMFNDENLRNDLAKLIELRKQHAKYAKQLAAVDEFMEWDAKLTRFEKMAAELFDFNAKFVHEEWNKKMAEAIQLLQSLRSGPYGTDTNIQWDVLTHPQTSVTLEQSGSMTENHLNDNTIIPTDESQQEDRIGNGDVVMEDDDRLQEPQHPTSDSPPTM
ncbi:hypothetical protein Q1695_000676 [Nippostrongylus brasiliensis]|nr:hypothetical protein Q1695_000676 [Nippostrongylus brasiliensis]